MSSLETFRAAYGRASNSELQWVADRARTTAGSLSPEGWLALTEEMERRGLTPPHDPVAGLDLDPSTDAERAAAPPVGLLGRVVRYAKAPVGARFVAYIIDALVAGVPMIAAALIMGLSGAFGEAAPPTGTIMLLFGAMIWAIYYSMTKDGWDGGRSIGKRAMGLMVVNEATNAPCSMGESSVRAIIMMLLSAVPLVGWLVEPILVIATDDGRRLGDRAAGTKVIEHRQYALPGARSGAI